MGKDLKGKELGVGLSQRKDGRYSAKFTNNQRQRTEKCFEKLKEAKDWLTSQRYIDSTVGAQSNMLVDDWYKHWMENYKENHLAANTVKNYRTRYKINIQPEIGKLKLCEVKQMHCQNIINKMQSSNKYSEGTMEQCQITMHSLFKLAIANNYLYRNPAENLIFRFKENRDSEDFDNERRVLSKSEQEEFLQYSEKTLYYNAFRLILVTGMRIGEIGGLRWSDIDYEKKGIYIKRTLLQDASKGGFYYGSPKTETSKRFIPLIDTAISILKDQQILQKRLKSTSKKWVDNGDLVFTTINGNPVGSSTFRYSMARVVNNINIDRKLKGDTIVFEKMYPHSLRHTFATRCVENGMQPKVLQKILGHATLAVTMDLYVHVTEELFAEESLKIVL